MQSARKRPLNASTKALPADHAVMRTQGRTYDCGGDTHPVLWLPASPGCLNPDARDHLGRHRKDQHAQCQFGQLFHGSVDQRRVDNASNDDHNGKHRVDNAPQGWRQAQFSSESNQKARSEDRPHCDHTPSCERGWRRKKQGINHVWRASDPERSNVHDDQSNQGDPESAVKSSAPCSGQAGKIATCCQWLHQQQRQGDDACQACHDVNRITPCQKRAYCRSIDRQTCRCRQGSPAKRRSHHGRPAAHADQAGCRTKSACRVVSRALCMTGLRKTVSNSASS